MRHNLAVIRRLWNSVVGRVWRRTPSSEELSEQLELDAERQRGKDAWLADEARQTRRFTGTGPGV
jgi:hypothetical protein